MDARKNAICAFQSIKRILQTIRHLIQYTVLEIRFWSVKYTTLTVRCAKIWSILVTSHKAMQTVALLNG